MTKMQPMKDAAIDQYGIGVFLLCRVSCRTDLFGESTDAATDEDIEADELWCAGAVSDSEATEECVGLTCGVWVPVDEYIDDLFNDNFELAGWNLLVTAEDISDKESRDADIKFEEAPCADSTGVIDVWADIDLVLLE